MKKIFATLVALCAICSFNAFAETEEDAPEKESSFTAGGGITMVSSYLWRGSRLDMACLQPDAYISWKGLTLDVWGSTGLVMDSPSKEIDLSLSYEIKGFSIGFTDYYCPAAADAAFFINGSHTLEVGVGYDFGFLALSWYTNVGFDDQYSSYFEISAPFSIGAVDFSAAVGCSPYRSDFYGTSTFNVINCSLTAGKEFEFEKCSIPVFATLMANPAAKDMFFCCGAGISF